jgi:hypothetical protein
MHSAENVTSPSMLHEKMRRHDFHSFVEKLSSTVPFSMSDSQSSWSLVEGSCQNKEEQMIEPSKSANASDLHPNLKAWLAERCTELDNIIERTQDIVDMIKGGKELMEGDLTQELANKLEDIIRELREKQAEVLPSLASILRSANEGNGLSDSGYLSNQDPTEASSSKKKQEVPEYCGVEARRSSSDDSTFVEDLVPLPPVSSHYSQDAISSRWNVNHHFTGQYLALVAPLWSSVLNSIGTSKGLAELEKLKFLGSRFTREECRLLNTAHHLHVRYMEHRENVLLALEDPDIVDDVLKEEEILLQVLEILKYEVSACYEGERKPDKSVNF